MTDEPQTHRGLFWQELRRAALMPGLPITLLVLLFVILVALSRHVYD